MSGEWNAWDTRSFRVRRPRAATRAAMSSTGPSAPETTTEAGPLTAATETCPACPARSGATSSSVASRETMAPPSGRASMRRPRAVTRAQASARVNTPATWAAAISPTECPVRWSGVTPQDSTSRNRATSRANRAGCAYPVRSRRAASSLPSSARSRGRSGRSSPASRWSRISSRARAKTGKRAYSSRPMPGRWAPWPEKSTASLVRARTWWVVRPGASSPAASAVRRVTAVSRPSVVKAARCSRVERVVASAWETSRAGSAGLAARWSSSRAAWARSACGVRPDSSQGSAPASTAGTSSSPSAAGSCGASSMMVCALVPDRPKEETPARRGAFSRRGQGVGSVSRRTAPSVQSTWVEGRSTWRVRGSRSWRIAMTILMMPATPAAACVWLMLDLTEPSSSGLSASRPCP
ncbi:hypothetical protein EES47_24770 [Streptomyces sp. ADI98-12]|nr:hypothetical protein EES47_24770 [Streptomyces sp. ADI98-12]